MSIRLRHYIRDGLRHLLLFTLFVLGANLIVLVFILGDRHLHNLLDVGETPLEHGLRTLSRNRPFETRFHFLKRKEMYFPVRLTELFWGNLDWFCIKLPIFFCVLATIRFAWNCVWILKTERRSAAEWGRFLVDGHIPSSEIGKTTLQESFATRLRSLGVENGIRLFVNSYLTRFNPNQDKPVATNGRRIESNSPRNINDRETAAKFEESIRPCVFQEILKRYPDICCCQFPAEGSEPIWRGLVSSAGDREHWRFFYCFQVDREDLVTNVSGVAWYLTRFPSQRSQAMGRLRGDEEILVPPWWRVAGGTLLQAIARGIPLFLLALLVLFCAGFAGRGWGWGGSYFAYCVQSLVYMLPFVTCVLMLFVFRKRWWKQPFTDWDPEEWKWNARFGELGIWSVCQDIRTSDSQTHPKSVPMPASLASKLEGMFNAMEEATQSAITNCARAITQSNPPEPGNPEKPSGKGKRL